MGWSQPQTPIQTDNSSVAGFTNKKISNKATKSADTKLWWLRDGESQEQFRYYWAPRSEMKKITSQSIILQYIMKQREQAHTWSDFPFPHIFVNLGKLSIRERVCWYRWNYFHVGNNRKSVMSRLSQQRNHYLTC